MESTLLDWCRKKRLTVDLEWAGEGSWYLPDTTTIRISHCITGREQLYCLLHECGHYLIHKGGARRFAAANGHGNADETRVAILAEELEAWYRGRRLAQRLEISIDSRSWNFIKKQYLKTYGIQYGRAT